MAHKSFNSQYISLTKKEYNSLLEDRRILQALRDAGVDNWEGYSQALTGGEDEESEEDIYG